MVYFSLTNRPMCFFFNIYYTFYDFLILINLSIFMISIISLVLTFSFHRQLFCLLPQNSPRISWATLSTCLDIRSRRCLNIQLHTIYFFYHIVVKERTFMFIFHNLVMISYCSSFPQSPNTNIRTTNLCCLCTQTLFWYHFALVTCCLVYNPN